VTGARAASAAHVRRRAAGATEVTRTDTQATGEAARRRGLPARFVTTCFCSVMAGQPGGGVPVAGSMLEFCSGFHCRIGGMIRGDPAGGILLDPPDSHWPGDPPRRCRFNSPRQPAQQLLWASLPRLPDSPGCCCTCSRTCRALATSCAVAVALQLAPSGAKVGVWRTTPVGYDVTALAPSGALSCASCAALP
jgi:hypothetical protein